MHPSPTRLADLPPWLWPMAATMQAGAAMFGAFGGLPSDGVSAADGEETAWTTPHEIVLDTAVMRVRRFGDGSAPSVIVVAPYSMHGALLADIAPGFSLVQRLLDAGLRSLRLVEWKSATPRMQYLGIDDYLLRLSAILDDGDMPATLIGLCQGGWLSLLAAARFPRKIARLVLVGAPVDLDAAPSPIVTGARLAVPDIASLLTNGSDGLVPGHALGSFLNGRAAEREIVAGALQTETIAPETLDRFQRWYMTTLDLPGAYFSQVVAALFQRNAIARGDFHAFGRSVDLSAVKMPVYVLASAEDEIVPLPQAVGVRALIGTPAEQVIVTETQGNHLSLFMGARTLETIWGDIALWILSERIPGGPA